MMGVLVETEHGHEFGLAAALEARAVRCAELDDLLYDVALLIDFHRIDGGVGAVVAEFLDRALELAGQRLDSGAQDIGESEQKRQSHALGVQVERKLEQVEPPLGIAVGMDGHVSRLVHPEVPLPPAAHVVELLGVPGGPGRRRRDGGGDRDPLRLGQSAVS